MSKYEVKVTNEKNEEVYKGEVEVRSTEKAEHYAQAIANANERNDGRCDWEVKAK